MPECWEPECKTPWTMHYHHESVRWNLYMLQRTCVWVSSTNVPCSLVTPLYGKLAWAPLLQIYENFHKTYTFRRVVARVVVRVVVAENKENLNFVFFTNNYPSNYPCPKCVFSYTLGTDACRASGRAHMASVQHGHNLEPDYQVRVKHLWANFFCLCTCVFNAFVSIDTTSKDRWKATRKDLALFSKIRFLKSEYGCRCLS